MKFEYKFPWIEILDLERNASFYFQSMAFISFLGSSLYILMVRQVNDFLKEPRERRLGLLPLIWSRSRPVAGLRRIWAGAEKADRQGVWPGAWPARGADQPGFQRSSAGGYSLGLPLLGLQPVAAALVAGAGCS